MFLYVHFSNVFFHTTVKHSRLYVLKFAIEIWLLLEEICIRCGTTKIVINPVTAGGFRLTKGFLVMSPVEAFFAQISNSFH